METVPQRELWRHEALDFTRWLAQNLDLLAEKVGGDLSFVEREVAAGAFSADILAEDGGGNLVIIENQLERTDHDHLGKLITYMSNLDARRAIWVSSDPRPEHEKAIHWLNEVLPADTGFYLVKVEAVRIGDSPAAPLFTVVAGPSEAARIVGEEKKEMAERHIKRRKFWTQLLERAKSRTKLHTRISPSTDNWISASLSGMQFNYVVLMSGARCEVYIETGSAEQNKHIFDRLYARREEIEGVFGDALNWQRLDDRKACRIAWTIDEGGLADESSWPSLQAQMIDGMVRLERAFAGHLR